MFVITFPKMLKGEPLLRTIGTKCIICLLRVLYANWLASLRIVYITDMHDDIYSNISRTIYSTLSLTSCIFTTLEYQHWEYGKTILYMISVEKHIGTFEKKKKLSIHVYYMCDIKPMIYIYVVTNVSTVQAYWSWFHIH